MCGSGNSVVFESVITRFAANMDDRYHFLLSRKKELLKKRKELLDIKLQLQKEVDIPQPYNFGAKYGNLPEAKASSIVDGLHHRLSDVRYLQPLECHMLFGLKVVVCNKRKLVVQFRPSYMDKILPEVYAISLLRDSNGEYSVEKYHLPLSIQMKPLVRQWSPLKKDNLRNFLLDIKQQTNAFHHRQQQILQLKEMVDSRNTTLKIFHPLSMNYIILTTNMIDSVKSRTFTSLNLILTYDSNYLPTKLDIECSEMEEEQFAVAEEQFSAFKLYPLREAFEICCIKTERFSLPGREDAPNENLSEEDDNTSVSSKDGNVCDVRSTELRTRSRVNKKNRVLSTIEGTGKTRSESSTKGKRNRNRDNSSTSAEEDIAERNTIDSVTNVAEIQVQKLQTDLKKTKKANSKSSAKGTKNLASKGKSNIVQTKKQFKTLLGTNKKAPKKKISPDDGPSGISHTKRNKKPHGHPKNKVTSEAPSSDKTNDSTSVSSEEEKICDVSSTELRTRSHVNKKKRVLSIVEETGKTRSESSTKGKRNRNGDNSSTSAEEDIAEKSASDASTIDTSKIVAELQLQKLQTVLQKTKKANSKSSTKGTKNLASKGKSNIVQTKKQFKTLRETNKKAPKKKISPDDGPRSISHTKEKKKPRGHPKNKVTNEVPTSDQTNKIERYLLRSKR